MNIVLIRDVITDITSDIITDVISINPPPPEPSND